MNSNTTMSAVSADRNLLFGLLALQNNFISRDQLVSAFGVWVADKSRPLDEILYAQKGHRVKRDLYGATGIQIANALVALPAEGIAGENDFGCPRINSHLPPSQFFSRPLSDRGLEVS
jgi:hypothetical protein